MAERPSQAYACQSKGCANGFGSTFYAAPEIWYTERGFSTPKNCPDCRKWVNDQTDEAVNCSSCRRSRLIPAKYKISHHKRTGPWETPEMCKRCEEGKSPRSAAKAKSARTERTRPAEKGLLAFAKIAEGIPVEARWIETDPHAYQAVRPQDGETHQAHIEHHIDGSQLSWVDSGKSPTAFASGPDSFVDFLSIASRSMQSVDPERTRDFPEERFGRPQLVRLTLLSDDQHIEKTVIDEVSGRLITSYDTITIQKARDTYGSK